MFNSEIFKRWKNKLLKKDEEKKLEVKEIFKSLDDKRRGFIKGECLIKHIV